MPVRRLAGLLAVVGPSLAAAALLLPHSPAQLREASIGLAAGVLFRRIGRPAAAPA